MKQSSQPSYDIWLLCATFILLGLSILMVFSTTAVISKEFYGDSTTMIKKHLLHVFLGLAAFGCFSRLPPMFLRKLAIPALLFSIFMLVLVLIPSVGYSAGGARRWISLGFFNLQPGEICKILLVVYFAAYIDSNFAKMRAFLPGVLVPFFLLSMIGALLLLEPDFGTTAVIGIVVFGQLLSASRISHLVALAGVGVLSGLLLVISSPYRMTRLLSFMNPFESADTSGYQLIQSLIAVGSGGIWGSGLGSGSQKLFYLPAAHTDFIFAVIAEELGLLGAFAVLLLFSVILYRGIMISKKLSDKPFLSSLALGCTLMIVVPALLNMGVVTGLLPTKGLVLPLVAYGGTAMIVHLAAAGVLLSLSAET